MKARSTTITGPLLRSGVQQVRTVVGLAMLLCLFVIQLAKLLGSRNHLNDTGAVSTEAVCHRRLPYRHRQSWELLGGNGPGVLTFVAN